MAIVDKLTAILEMETIPVSCSICGAETEFQSPSEPVRYALETASYIQSYMREIELLQRTQALFEQFPSSHHPIKIYHESVDKAERAQAHDDREFEQALKDDPELNSFLKRNSFLLPARLCFISQACAELHERLDDSQIRCTACNDSYYVIDPAFLRI